MPFNALFSEQYLYLGGILCNGETTAQNTGWLDMKDVTRVTAGIMPINLGANVAITVHQATSSAGAGAKVISTDKHTTIETGDDAPTIIEVSASEMDAENDFRYIRFTGTPASASACTYSLMVVGRAEELPAYTTDLERVVN